MRLDELATMEDDAIGSEDEPTMDEDAMGLEELATAEELPITEDE
jgi:hypothetical protein